jgi:hypothetical protein
MGITVLAANTLVPTGIATPAWRCPLRKAVALDYRFTVLADACLDGWGAATGVTGGKVGRRRVGARRGAA